MAEIEHPMRPLVRAWTGAITKALEYKRGVFGRDADEAMRFFNGPYDWLYQSPYASQGKWFTFSETGGIPTPSFRMTHNRVAEMVQIFGPVLYSRNPNRQVVARSDPELPSGIFGVPGDPSGQLSEAMFRNTQQQSRSKNVAIATLLETYLNYTPNELGLKAHTRRAIDEAIIKGMGVLWTEVKVKPGSGMAIVGSFQDSVDNLVIDADMESLDDAQWCARRIIQPTWEAERKFGLPPGTLDYRGNMESYRHQGAAASSKDTPYDRKRGLTNDLLIYWEVYSKMGMGARISGAGPMTTALNGIRKELELFGDYCYLVVTDAVPYPLNLPPHILESATDEEIYRRVQWPIPFYQDDGWPFTPIQFHEVPRSVWPMSHLKPALGELTFLNWAFSFLAGKVRTISRDFIAVLKSASEEVKRTVLEGSDLELIEVEALHTDINKVVQFLSHPQLNPSIFRVIAMVSEIFDKRVGLSELMYGQSSRQLRSASEAQVKGSQLQIRPDDMSSRVEEAMTTIARKEAITARHKLDGQHVAPILGPTGASWWDRLVKGVDVSYLSHEFEYRIEAGSMRRPWRDEMNLTSALNNLGPMLVRMAEQTGDATLIRQLLSDWAKSTGLDADRYLIPDITPRQQQGAPSPGPGPAPGPRGNGRVAGGVPAGTR